MNLTSLTKVEPYRPDAAAVTPAGEKEPLNDMFLQLLVAQLQYQDPSQPVDSSQYVQQLAQMAQMESMSQIGTQLTQIGTMVEDLQRFNTHTLTGQQVMVQSDTIELNADGTVVGELKLTTAAREVRLILRDNQGNDTTISLGSQQAGDVPFSFEAAELGLAAGKYQVSAWQDSQPLPVLLSGRIDYLRPDFNRGETRVHVAGVGEVDAGNIRQFGVSERPVSGQQAMQF
ncbi:flagellar hook capping FlgD N-terminal domain-containing protein [Pantoea sp. A4]|uniref:flagellar hook capping FlgD N-terminal domain-containing protein n=1 Tax=Pantoea sp. A4 TaxID=1225184 RepID=UPI00036D38A8|nr:flagellar hook capping FlgD N-terminal domain-containing protein [Pantoea sp. A4]